MSNDLISRSALIEQLNLAAPEYYNAYINQIIINAPAADVEVVQRGQWRLAKAGERLIAECPQCGMTVDATLAAWWNYCPVCGLKTDTEGEDTWEADTCD